MRRVHFTRATQKKNICRSEKFKSFLINAVRTLSTLRRGLKRRLKDRSDVPRRRVEIGPGHLEAQRN